MNHLYMNEFSNLKFNLQDLEKLESQIYNRHLQFHYYSTQLADLHNQITNMISFVKETFISTRQSITFYKKEIDTHYIEKLTKSVTQDCLEYQNQISNLKDEKEKYIMPHSIFSSKANSILLSLISYVKSIENKILDYIVKDIPRSEYSKYVPYPHMSNMKRDPVELRSPVTEQNFDRKPFKRNYSRFKNLNQKENKQQNLKNSKIGKLIYFYFYFDYFF